ncbi:hypothetical protein DIT68_04065 [Brumimicrobium oceani]|uniref:Uncharacterized protein n=1 Tax=Brumimicrobium oceani TaxID=2100725 RepID=A0A2U2XF82_9FLAO|nr:hypothetical protein DIT68_04065 [Brumimicrobium oceani]
MNPFVSSRLKSGRGQEEDFYLFKDSYIFVLTTGKKGIPQSYYSIGMTVVEHMRVGEKLKKRSFFNFSPNKTSNSLSFRTALKIFDF